MTARSSAQAPRETALALLWRVGPERILRRPGPDCACFYRLEGDRPVERAVFDDGRVGATYTAGYLDGVPADEVDVVDAGDWPSGDAPQAGRGA